MRDLLHEPEQRRRSRRRMLLALATGWLLAPLRDAGAVEVARERRAIGPLREVVADGPGDLVITQGMREDLVVEAEARLLPRISAQVADGVLRFDYGTEPIFTRAPIRFHVTVRELRHIDLAGSGSCSAGRIEAAHLAVRISGSGDMRIDRIEARALIALISGAGSMSFGGEVERQRITISGSGDYQAAGLASRSAEVVIEGSGTVELAAAEHLAAHIAGSGTVRYRGRPQLVQRITGAGSIEAMGES